MICVCVLEIILSLMELHMACQWMGITYTILPLKLAMLFTGVFSGQNNLLLGLRTVRIHSQWKCLLSALQKLWRDSKHWSHITRAQCWPPNYFQGCIKLPLALYSHSAAAKSSAQSYGPVEIIVGTHWGPVPWEVIGVSLRRSVNTGPPPLLCNCFFCRCSQMFLCGHKEQALRLTQPVLKLAD